MRMSRIIWAIDKFFANLSIAQMLMLAKRLRIALRIAGARIFFSEENPRPNVTSAEYSRMANAVLSIGVRWGDKPFRAYRPNDTCVKYLVVPEKVFHFGQKYWVI